MGVILAIREIDRTAHIGGGAIRDALLGRPLKDIDVFIDDAVFDAVAAMLRSEFHYVRVSGWAARPEWTAAANGVRRLDDFEKHDETIRVSLIGMNPPRDMKTNLDRFDFGVCQAGWDGDRVYTTPAFGRDVAHRTFTLLRAPDLKSFTGSMRRFERIVAGRYEGWQLVIPLKFAALEREFRRNPPQCSGRSYTCEHGYAAMYAPLAYSLREAT